MFAIVIGLIVFFVYMGTLSPTVYLGDSGELIASAFSLGIPHNSGYPLYTIIGKAFCLIPVGNIGFRMNLMSTCFGTLTVWIVYSLIVKITSSRVSAFIGAFVLAFTPVLWLQTVSAEVYTLHTFFVALLIRLLWWWDERREFFILLLFVFLTGISFANHLQTVMLAPAVLFFIVSRDRKAVLNLSHFLIISLVFVMALSIYLYLPIRTWADAAIHWGDPDNPSRFLAHVAGRSHRAAYVMSKTPWEYVIRTKETLSFVWSQFGIMLLFSVWGWLRLTSSLWRVFFALVVVFDFVYTVLLNIVSLEVTAFTLPTSIALSILMGIGTAHLLRALGNLDVVNTGIRKLARVAFCFVPVVAMVSNYGLCDQSRNYAGYEQAKNVFRTPETGDILFLHGDNYVFPVAYGRIAERMREDVEIYDRLSVIFKMPTTDVCSHLKESSWEEERDCIEKSIIEKKQNRNAFYGVFNPHDVKLTDGWKMVPYGLLRWVAGEGAQTISKGARKPWDRYLTESHKGEFEKDFMNRQVSAYFYFRRGETLILSGQHVAGLGNMRLASEIGYDDIFIHSDMAVFLTDHGFFGDARQELQKALLHYEDLSKVHNNWGYYYHKIGDYEEAIISFEKAIELDPEVPEYYNNLAFSLYEDGKKALALEALRKSLAINEQQPELYEFIEKKLIVSGLKYER